jgi:type I restriction enzyme S subunit
MIGGLKPYLAYKDSGVPSLGRIPEHWQVRRMRNAVEMRVSNVDKHSNEGEFAVRLCNYVDVYKHERITEDLSFMRATALLSEIERFKLQVGDVLITKDSESWTDIGVPALVKYSADDLLCGYHLALLRPFADVNGSFLFRVLQCAPIAYQFHVEANGVTRYGLSHSAIKAISLPVAPPSEQAAIARFLDNADARIRRYIRTKQALIKLLEEEKRAIVQRVITRGLDPNARLKPSGADWLGDVPQHWQVRRAKYLFREIDIRTMSGTEELLSLRMYRGLVPHKDVSSSPISADALIGYKKVEPGQIVMNRMRAAIGMFGVADQPGLVSPDYAVFIADDIADAEYYLRLFKTASIGAVFRVESKGLGTGSSGFMRLYTDRFGTIKLPVPPKSEQGAIVKQLATETQEIERAEQRVQREISLLREFRSRLISDVVTGKLDVREAASKLPDIEPEAEPLDEIEDLPQDEETANAGELEAEDAA